MNKAINTDTTKKSSAPNKSDFQEKIMTQIRELGDTLERAGEKVEASGWQTIGQAIYKLGNTLEHMKGGKPYTDKEFDEKSKTLSAVPGKHFSDKSTSVDKIGGDDSQAY